MYCEKCGNQISEKALFCEQCGTKVENYDVAPSEHTKGTNWFGGICEKIKTDKKTQKLCAVIGGVFILLVAMTCILANAANTIKLTDYVIVDEISGINGYATVEYSFEWDALYADVFGEAPQAASDRKVFREITSQILTNPAKKSTIDYISPENLP